MKKYEFVGNGFIFSLLWIDCTTEEENIYKVNKWNSKGQLVDTFTVTANTVFDAEEKILNN